MRMPGLIPPGIVVNEVAATIDFLPTLAELTGCPMGPLEIDGRSIVELMKGTPGATTPHEAYYYYYGLDLCAIRSGPWKLVFPHSYRSLVEPGNDGQPGPYRQIECGLELYHLTDDPSESNDQAAMHPEIVERLSRMADSMRRDLGDRLQSVKGSEVRPFDQFDR